MHSHILALVELLLDPNDNTQMVAMGNDCGHYRIEFYYDYFI
jgi:hypothetical protein